MVSPIEVHEKLEQCKRDVERRLANMENIFELAQEILESSNDVRNQVHQIGLSFSAYVAKSEEALKGFPNSDPDGHRKAHEAMIEAAQRRALFYRRMTEELAKWGVFGVISFIVGAIWLAIKSEVHK